MKVLVVLALSFSVVAAAEVKVEADKKESKRTGRQFGWQNPFFPHPYAFGTYQQYQDLSKSKPVSSDVIPKKPESLAKQNTKMETTGEDIMETLNEMPPIELKLKPQRVNASLLITRSHGKSKPAPTIIKSPAYSMSSYPPKSSYQQNQFQNLYGNNDYLSAQISTPNSPVNLASESMYDIYNPANLGMNNYNTNYGQYLLGHPSFGVQGQYVPSLSFGVPGQTNYNTNYEDYLMGHSNFGAQGQNNYNTNYGDFLIPQGHPSFGIHGQYAPSGGLVSNYNYLSNPMMAIANKPLSNDIENDFETVVPDNIKFACPVEISGTDHIVGQATIYPDPTKCNRFYYCQKGHAYVFQCSDDLYYNPEIRACDNKQYFSCGNRAL